MATQRVDRDRDIGRDVASALVWLVEEQVRDLGALVFDGDWVGAEAYLVAAMPELAGVARLSEPRWRAALREELALRIAPPGDDEQDDLDTREMPDLTRFALAR